jgi:alpha-glucosidase
MPLYVRAGTVLPLGPVMQHTGGWPPEALHLHIYPGDGESWLYEDDGHSLDHLAGNFRQTRYVCQQGNGRLVVRCESDGPFEPGYHEYEITIHGLQVAPSQVILDGRKAATAFDSESGTASLRSASWKYLEMLY